MRGGLNAHSLGSSRLRCGTIHHSSLSVPTTSLSQCSERQFTRVASRIRMKRRAWENEVESTFGMRKTDKLKGMLYLKHKESHRWLYNSIFYNMRQWLLPSFQGIHGRGKPKPRHLIDFGCGDATHLRTLLKYSFVGENNIENTHLIKNPKYSSSSTVNEYSNRYISRGAGLNYRRIVGVDSDVCMLERAELQKRMLPLIFSDLELIKEDCRFIQMPEIYSNLQNDFNDALLIDLLNCIDDPHHLKNIVQSLQLCLRMDSNIVGMVIDPHLSGGHSEEFYQKYGLQVLDYKQANLRLYDSPEDKQLVLKRNGLDPITQRAVVSWNKDSAVQVNREVLKHGNIFDYNEFTHPDNANTTALMPRNRAKHELEKKLKLPSKRRTMDDGHYEFVRNGNRFRILADCTGNRQRPKHLSLHPEMDEDVELDMEEENDRQDSDEDEEDRVYSSEEEDDMDDEFYSDSEFEVRKMSREWTYLDRVFWNRSTIEDLFDHAHLSEIEFRPLHSMIPDPTLSEEEQQLFIDFANETDSLFECFTSRKQRLLPLYHDRAFFDYSSPTKLLNR